MSVFTLYFCGTGSTRFDSAHPDYWNGELVSTLANHTEDQEFASWVILDGPGSGNLQADELTVQAADHPYAGVAFGTGWQTNIEHALNMMKGRFDWQRTQLTQTDYERLKSHDVPIDDAQNENSFWSRVYDYGERKVNQQALQRQIVAIHRKDSLIPTQVNLVGWSRGGVSCHMLANAMLEDAELKDIPVNIFTVDPVPGPLNFQADKVRLGDNVREYVGFYARDERSKTFACVIPVTHPASRVSIYPLPGRHATLAGNASPDGAQGPAIVKEPGMLVRHFAETCLGRWGVRLRNTLDLDNQAIVTAHQQMVAHQAIYTAMQKHSYLGLVESDQLERRVSLGDQWATFSSVAGATFTPSAGLAAEVAADIQGYDPLSGARAG
jgi:hypothetical protein